MYKYFLLSVLFISVFGVAQSQKLSVTVKYVTTHGPADKSTIYYDGQRKLTWDDFQGNPDNSVEYAALTSSGFGIDLEMHGNSSSASMTIIVFCTFSKPESWVKPDQKSDYILNHEQHHFDLTYIYTQRFVKKLQEANFTVKNYQDLIKRIYDDAERDLHDEQAKYDDETHHSVIKARQEEWNKKIDEELAALNGN
ncbi:MAG TPA: hypothetical protein VK718_12055 [Ferruginibacter sp.]|jgi:hypothetical protein|nr:hypothetical protein [Ferruginibacter sp.]